MLAPDGKRKAETITTDFADFFFRINTRDGTPANVSDVSRGIFGANTGTNRLLKYFSDRGIKATWFMPSHSILSFPDQMAKVRDAGHEM